MPNEPTAQPDRHTRRLRIILLVTGVAVALAVGGGWVLHDRYVVGRFHEMIPGELYHCRQPHPPQWWILDHYHIRRVINLRAEVEDADTFAEERRICREAGVDFVHIPVSALLPTDRQIARFLHAVRSRPGAVLWHCEHGRHRTSFMKAAYRVLVQEWAPERAVAEMADNDARPEGEKRAKTFAILRRLRDNRDEWLARTAPDAPAPPRAEPAE